MRYRARLELRCPDIVGVDRPVIVPALVSVPSQRAEVGLERVVIYGLEIYFEPSVADVLPERENIVEEMAELVSQKDGVA